MQWFQNPVILLTNRQTDADDNLNSQVINQVQTVGLYPFNTHWLDNTY